MRTVLGFGGPVLDAFQGRVLGSIPYANANISCNVRLLLPAAAESLINLYQGEEFIEPGLRQAEFCGEIVCLVREHFEVACGAALVALAGKLRRILGGVGEEFLLRAELLIFPVADERVGNAAEGALNRLLVDQ